MADNDVLEEVVAQLGLAVQPLVDATSSPEAMRTFLWRLGWDLDPAPAAITALQAPASQIYALVEGGDEVDSAALIGGVRAAFTAISPMRARVAASKTGEGASSMSF